MNTIKFFWNGLKINNGPLQKCHYTIGGYTASSGIPADTISIYKITNGHTQKVWFTPEVKEFFTIKNDTDAQSDYFETDSIRVRREHPLYAEVKKALEKKEEHYAKIKKLKN